MHHPIILFAASSARHDAFAMPNKGLLPDALLTVLHAPACSSSSALREKRTPPNWTNYYCLALYLRHCC